MRRQIPPGCRSDKPNNIRAREIGPEKDQARANQTSRKKINSKRVMPENDQAEKTKPESDM
jgi:hypothetical protein